MCWNEHVSLNTYVFSVGMLALMIYNNTYTPYKVDGFNMYWYFFILSFCTMQLIEYFLWTNLNDKKLNYLFSALGQLLIGLQPIASLFLLTNESMRNIMLFFYSIFVVFIFFTHKKIFKTTVENGHLKWSWIPIQPYIYFIWMFFLLFSFVINRYYIAIVLAILLYIMTNFSKGTGGSLWCWSINLSMIFYAIYLLIFMPLKEITC